MLVLAFGGDDATIGGGGAGATGAAGAAEAAAAEDPKAKKAAMKNTKIWAHLTGGMWEVS